MCEIALKASGLFILAQIHSHRKIKSDVNLIMMVVIFLSGLQRTLNTVFTFDI